MGALRPSGWPALRGVGDGRGARQRRRVRATVPPSGDARTEADHRESGGSEQERESEPGLPGLLAGTEAGRFLGHPHGLERRARLGGERQPEGCDRETGRGRDVWLLNHPQIQPPPASGRKKIAFPSPPAPGGHGPGPRSTTV
jgi:hypothetical protein